MALEWLLHVTVIKE